MSEYTSTFACNMGAQQVALGPATALELAWTRRSQLFGSRELWVKRFAVPSTSYGQLTSLTSSVAVVSTNNVSEDEPVALVHAGDDRLLAAWADDRGGPATEVYVAPIDLLGCP